MSDSEITTSTASVPAIPHPHGLTREAVINALNSSVHGLSHAEAQARLQEYGRNSLPQAEPPTLVQLFLRQFLSPLIYVLLLATIVSLLIKEWSDAGFIFAVLLINAVIGTYQEYSAERSAAALRNLISTRARVQREGEAHEINAEELVPGDIVLLESGSRVPADLRLIDSGRLTINESLLTGESQACAKDAGAIVADKSTLGDRLNMAFAATMVEHGRGRGVVVATGLSTEIGAIAATVIGSKITKPPLLVRMERFTFRIATFVAVMATLMGVFSFMHGMPLADVFLLSVALAVSAIPEGLPVALTIALAIGMNRMAKRNVIIRKLVAVESLGSCTYIASDKTGTLTINELTAHRIAFPGQPLWEISGEGTLPEGTILTDKGIPSPQQQTLLERLCISTTLCNEGFLGRSDSGWVHHGDSVDVALLVMAHKAGIVQPETINTWPAVAEIPFEAEHRFAASLNQDESGLRVSVKGALENLLPMCTTMASTEGDLPLDAELIEQQALLLANEGYRVLAVADGLLELQENEVFSAEHLHSLSLLGLVAMIDPLRPEVKAAIAQCRSAGIEVCMVTGDHPNTALAIARALELTDSSDQVVTGHQLKEAELAGPEAVTELSARARVFARVEPQQKQDIVRALAQLGHFVAVTGDGANDAPALKTAHVGVAMGKQGTDVARETAELVITDDNFASIVAGVEEGRVAYANVRKVIFLLVSTGAAEIVLFMLALITGLPLPLVAVQLLWLNLVTNGIQDVALAFEPAEGDELKHPPRPPREPIFNQLMLERTLLSAFTIGLLAFATYALLLQEGYPLVEARNALLLLMVLFENVHVFNCRSELRSAFRHPPMRNRLLLFGTLTAQLIHIAALYTPGISTILGTMPVSFTLWLQLLGIALTLLVVMELHKWLRKRNPINPLKV
jgi:Ca2+-transporting ATPase